ncbi:MAG: hypothetical protein ACRD5M_01225 [Candidatus Acidiferrales bacterium]
MTTAAKFTYGVALLIGLSIGAITEFHNASFAFQAFHDGLQATGPAMLGDFSYLQYKHADSEHAKVALQTYANLMEEMVKLNPEEARHQDLAFTYLRLALLEDASNNREQSHAYMTKARYWNAARGGRDLSDSKMKAALNARDAVDDQLHR